ELLDLLAAEPPAQRPVPAVPVPSGLALGLHLALAAAASGSADGTAVVVAPRAVVDVVLGRRGDAVGGALGGTVAPVRVRRVARGDAEVRDLGYVRHTATLRGMVGFGAPGAASAVIGVEAGASLAQVAAHAADGTEVGSDTRVRFVAGLYGELRQPIAAGIGV